MLRKKRKKKHRTNTSSRVENHEIWMAEQSKLALNTFDDEKYFNNKTEIVPWGFLKKN